MIDELCCFSSCENRSPACLLVILAVGYETQSVVRSHESYIEVMADTIGGSILNT